MVPTTPTRAATLASPAAAGPLSPARTSPTTTAPRTSTLRCARAAPYPSFGCSICLIGWGAYILDLIVGSKVYSVPQLYTATQPATPDAGNCFVFRALFTCVSVGVVQAIHAWPDNWYVLLSPHCWLSQDCQAGHQNDMPALEMAPTAAELNITTPRLPS